MRAYQGFTLTAAVALLSACGGKGSSEAAATAAPTITLGASDLAVATRATLRAGVPLSGPLDAKVSVVVGAPLAEQLVAVLVAEGDAVSRGQVLARFRDDVLRSAAVSAQADLARARAAVSLAAADSARADALFAEGAIARRDRDNALLAVDQARAQLALAAAQLAGAEDRLAGATLTAPVSGVVSARHAQAGDRVDFGKPVISIVNTRVLQLDAAVEARWLGAVRVGRPVALTVAGGARDTLMGRIARVNPVADPATRQVRIYVDVPNPAGRLVSGLYVSGMVLTETVTEAVTVPRAAIRIDGADRASVVFVVAAGRVSRRVVDPGVQDAASGRVEIRSGVSAGESVVIGPVDGLGDGTRVEIAGTPASR